LTSKSFIALYVAAIVVVMYYQVGVYSKKTDEKEKQSTNLLFTHSILFDVVNGLDTLMNV